MPSDDHLGQLTSLTYLSTATDLFSVPELEALLEASRERNSTAGLTGMLLYAGGHFIQTLEGPGPVVDEVYLRIERDPRHRDMFVALREAVAGRTFPEWSMGFEMCSLEEASRLPGFNDYLESQEMPAERGLDLGRAGIFHRVFRDNMR